MMHGMHATRDNYQSNLDRLAASCVIDVDMHETLG